MSAPTTNLSPAIIDWCKSEALGQVLCQWGKDDDALLTYEQVTEWFDDLDSDTPYGVDDDNGIMVWEQFEDNTGSWIADQIRSLYDSYIKCAQFAKEN